MTDETIAAARDGGRNDRNARAGERAQSEYSKSPTPRQFPPLDVRGAAFADLCGALGFERNARLSDDRHYRSGRRGSFVADLPTGRWYDHQADIGGAAAELVIHAGCAKDFQSAADWLRARQYAGAAPDAKRDAEQTTRDAQRAKRAVLDAEARSRKARLIWRTSSSLTAEDLGGCYLAARAIPAPWPGSLRFASCAWNGEVRRDLPAMVAAVTPLDAPTELSAIHRTWLAEPGRKADLEAPRKALGAIGGCGVVLGEIADEVLVAEGIETALSASRALRLPAVAALGCANMRRLIIPASVNRVVITPDRDEGGAGERAARDLGAALLKRGVRVMLAWSPRPHSDWNDAAQAGVLTDGGLHV